MQIKTNTKCSNNTRHDWELEEILNFFHLSFSQLISRAHEIFKQNFDVDKVQISTLLSIKTGSCPENCKYCPQSAHYSTGLKKEPLMEVDDVLEAAKKAKNAGAMRFCMGAAFRGPKDVELDKVCMMIKKVRELGLETCVTLGLLKEGQAEKLKAAGLDYYNHNIDTSEEFYDKVITSRKFQDRLDTLEKVEKAGINVCCGGIIGMGESIEDRAKFLQVLANREKHPESVPINWLIPIPGTPLANIEKPHPIDFVKVIAIARILMPFSFIRLSAGREQMTDECQALCFYAGANSIFYGETLLTAGNPVPERDENLFNRLGLKKIVCSGEVCKL